MLHTNQQQRTHENVTLTHRLCQLNRLHQIEDIHRTVKSIREKNQDPVTGGGDMKIRTFQDCVDQIYRNDAAAPTLLLRLAARRAMARAQPAIRATPTIIPIMTPDMNPISSVLFSTRHEREGTREEEKDLKSKGSNYIRKFLDQIDNDCLSRLFITANAAFGTDFFAW